MGFSFRSSSPVKNVTLVEQERIGTSGGQQINQKQIFLKCSKIKLLRWVEDYQRLSKMSHSLYLYRTVSGVPPSSYSTGDSLFDLSERDVVRDRLDKILRRVQKKARKKEACFSTLYSLYELFYAHDSLIILDREISRKFFLILIEFAWSPIFQSTTEVNCDILLGYLKAQFDLEKFDMQTLVQKWKISSYYFPGQNIGLPTDLRGNFDPIVIEKVYFEPLKCLFMKKLSYAVKFLPTVFGLGKFSSKYFVDFLEKYDILYSGPYRIENNEHSVRYFISNAHTLDSIFNSNNPLYGVYDIKSRSLNFRPEVAANFLANLPLVPEWLHKRPDPFQEISNFETISSIAADVDSLTVHLSESFV